MILVTGGTGLVGAHILLDLCRTEEKVCATKRESSNLYLVKSIFEFYEPDLHQELYGKIEWRIADLTDVDSLLDATKDIHFVYHAAAVVSFNPKDRQKMVESNINGTANLVNACQQNGIKKIGHISSVAALGPSKAGGYLDENCHWEISPENSAYAISKHGAEREVWRISEEGIDVVIVNPSLIIGPGDWNYSSTAIFKTTYENLKYYTEGTTGFVDVRDVSKAIVQLVNSEIKSERYVISAENLVWRDVFSSIAKGFGKKPPHRKVTKISAEIAWRLLKVLSWFSGNPPKVTKDSARASLRPRGFSNLKSIEQLQLQYRSVEEGISTTIDFLNKFYVNNTSRNS